jgi:hypothetical protein
VWAMWAKACTWRAQVKHTCLHAGHVCLRDASGQLQACLCSCAHQGSLVCMNGACAGSCMDLAGIWQYTTHVLSQGVVLYGCGHRTTVNA